jgi:hypothetical protein
VIGSRGKNVRVSCGLLFWTPIPLAFLTLQGPTRRRLLLTPQQLEVPTNCAIGRRRAPASSDLLKAESNSGLVSYRATWTPSFTGLFPDHEHKRNLGVDVFTARQQVVGCSKDKILRNRGHRIKETQKRTKPQPTTGQSKYTLLMPYASCEPDAA